MIDLETRKLALLLNSYELSIKHFPDVSSNIYITIGPRSQVIPPKSGGQAYRSPSRKYQITEPDGSRRMIHLAGRIAECLDRLIAAESVGISTRDYPDAQVSNYVHELKMRYGLKIVTIKELRRGIYNKYQAQYTLISKVKPIDVCEVN